MNTRKWAEGVTHRGALIIGVVHLLALLLGITAGPGWLDLDLAALFVGYAALVATVLVIIRKPLPDPPPVTLAMVILTVVTPALVGVIAHGIVQAIAVEQGRTVDVKWTPDRLYPGDVAYADVRVESGYARLRVPVSYTDPAADEGSCPNSRVSVLMDGRPPLHGKKDSGNGESVEFEMPEHTGRVKLSMELNSTQNCTIAVQSRDVTFYR
jgi:hypothetical protein